jgi:hypothetical protein
MTRETEALEAFLDVVEAGIVQARRVLEGSSWNPDTIKWEARDGTKGPYERSEDVNNLQFKAMLKELAAHDGKLTRDGLFYWTFQNGHTVGRKKAKFQKKS